MLVRGGPPLPWPTVTSWLVEEGQMATQRTGVWEKAEIRIGGVSGRGGCQGCLEQIRRLVGPLGKGS